MIVVMLMLCAVPSAKAADSDGDQVDDANDQFPDDPSQWNDTDGDGFGDNPSGTAADSCPLLAGSSYLDLMGCPDYDSDGISDMNDMCPATNLGFEVDQNGCAASQKDSDSDGVLDDSDICPETSPGDNVDSTGCSPAQFDSDNDGILDSQDFCPHSNPNYGVDASGCGIDQIDTDYDGVTDLKDICPNTQLSDTVDVYGCALSQSDSDSDGFSDLVDAFPFDPNQNSDVDGDGFGDNVAGVSGDDCINLFGTSMNGLRGCPDSDGDGMADIIDQCPNEPSNLSLGCPDLDDDGFLDYGKDRVDFCAFETGSSDQGGVYGCIDSDEDGWADIIDAFDDDKRAWGDGDEDGFTDQSGLNYSDDCPSSSGSSTIYLQGCPDLDRDGVPDFFDEDIDGDGIINAWEKQVEPSTNASNASQTPEDSDGDGLPDELDKDDDGDGFPDVIEVSRGSDPLNSEETPLSTVRGIDIGFSTGFIYSPTGDTTFSTDYSEDGFEVSITRVISLLSSGAIAFLLPLIASLPLLRKKKKRFNRIQNELEELNSLDRLEEMEYELDDLIARKRLKIDSALLLRNLLERKQDEIQRSKSQQFTNTDSPVPVLQPPPMMQPPPALNHHPYTSADISIDKDGFEWTKTQDGSNLYRKAGTIDWLEWN